MEDNNIFINFKLLFNIELAKRILSVILFVPIFIYSLHVGGSILFFLFIIFFQIILSELVNIYRLTHLKIYIALYSLLAAFSIVLFPFYYFSIENNFITCSYILVSLWLFDTFSYLGGNIFKGKKIFPNLSKGKTYSGLISGLSSVLLFNLIISVYFPNKLLLNLFYLASIICSLSFIGDSLVSFLKRKSNLKDTGKLFIGHGGFLDRMDSFILVFFFFIIFDLHKLIYYA